MGYQLDEDRARLDLDAIWAFLSADAYWGRWRDRDTVRRQIDASWRVVAAYDTDSGELVGFARAISDGEAIAYLADVFVHPDHRGGGLGVALVQRMIEEGPGRDFRWMLHTADAHGLYERFGFAEPDKTYLERPARGALTRTATESEP